MRRQNRVDPQCALVAVAARGTLMGNRGCLHDDSGNIVRLSARDASVTCLLSFKERQRQIMQPGHYTELFFLDEATALAAGHRPCSECRRERYVAYQEAWARVFGLAKRPTAKDIDLQLKQDRPERRENVVSDLKAIPTGAIVQAGKGGDFYLVRDGRLHRWSFDGYGLSVSPADVAAPLVMVTRACHVRILRSGYVPALHPSLGRR
jgi:hypothetical protein